jgi:hypothetical protein
MAAVAAVVILFSPSERRMWDTRGWRSRRDLSERESDT